MAASCFAEAVVVDAGARRRPFDFSAAAGPLPAPVAAQVAEACRDWRGLGSVLGLPFTSQAFAGLMDQTRALLRDQLGIPDSHELLFLQGGASAQFALVPLNLLGQARGAAYVESGHWSRRAIAQARRHGEVLVVAHPGQRVDARAAYLHLTSNETVDGLQWHEWPAVGVPLAVDMTSDFLTRPVDWSRVALGYAAMQKAIGVAGLTVVVVRRDLLGRARAGVPPVFDYAAQAAAGSRLNTPPVFAIFVTHEMLRWIAAAGGVAALALATAQRSARVYEVLDRCEAVFRVGVPVAQRSRNSICFAVGSGMRTAADNERCIAAAQAVGLHGLCGHPQAGGLRAAIYAGTSDAAVDRLCDFLAAFARGHSAP